MIIKDINDCKEICEVNGSKERREVEMRKLFSLSIENETIESLRRIAATRQLETGDKISVTAIIIEAVSEYLKTSA